MPANLENSAVVTEPEKVRFHSNPKARQCQRTTIWSSNSTPGYLPEENKNTNSKRYMHLNVQSWGFPGGASGKEPACQCRRHKRWGFNPWDWKIPWRRKWQPTKRVTKSQTRLKQFSMLACTFTATLFTIAKIWGKLSVHQQMNGQRRCIYFMKCEVLVVPDSLWPHRLQPTRLLCPWDFPGKNTGVGSYFLLQGIFPT